MNEKLIAHLKSKPSIKVVYMNDNGEWLFHTRPGYTEFKREDILKEKEEKTNKSEKTNK